MRRIMLGLLLAIAGGAAAADDGSRREPRQTPVVDLPADWRAQSELEAALSYARFARAVRGGPQADGTGLGATGRFGVGGGFFVLLGLDYYWLQDDAAQSVDFGYVRAAVGYRATLQPGVEVGAELGAQGQVGTEFFGKNRVTEDAEFGRAWLVWRLLPTTRLRAAATLGSDYRALDLRVDWPLVPRGPRLGIAAAAGTAEGADFWSVGPSLHWAFGR